MEVLADFHFSLEQSDFVDTKNSDVERVPEDHIWVYKQLIIYTSLNDDNGYIK